ncbi:MAG: glycosyltransferase involved in cell wall biosynthesis [Verrucomicrobiales bacterium]|jgi:glycosyltransferase involved in cell wall biosynthesis
MNDSPATISIALCTCNGAAYLQHQLGSIAAQTRLPDELVVGDDASTDQTLELLDAFAATVSYPVRVESHASRQGVAKNFESAVKRCTGTYIAFCDQDDAWHPEKLARLEACMDAHPDWALVFHDLELVDDALEPLGSTMWKSIGFDAQKQGAWARGGSFDLLLQRPMVTGAGLMVRRARLDPVLPFSERWIHDAWLSLILSTTDTLGFLAEPLTRYRQHSANEVGGLATSDRSYYEASRSLERQAYYADQVAAMRDLVEQVTRLADVPDERVYLLQAKLDFLERRSRLPGVRLARVPAVLGSLIRGEYRQFSRGWKVAARDLVLSG